MANEPVVTLTGNISEPTMRFTPSGKGVLNFGLAVTNRVKSGDQWVDGNTMWVKCTVWDKPAENAGNSLSKGDRVIVTGRLAMDKWQAQDGSEREGLVLQVEEIGVSLRYAEATPTRVSGQGATVQQGRGQQQGQQGQQQAASNDPWAVQSTGGAFTDEPPF